MLLLIWECGSVDNKSIWQFCVTIMQIVQNFDANCILTINRIFCIIITFPNRTFIEIMYYRASYSLNLKPNSNHNLKTRS